MSSICNRVAKCLDIALHVACTVYVYRRGNDVPLQKSHYAGADHYDERSDDVCANEAVRYGKALADNIKGLMR